MFLDCRHGAEAGAIVKREAHGDDYVRAILDHHVDRQRVGGSAVDEQASIHLPGREDDRDGNAGAYRVENASFGESYLSSCEQVRGHDLEGYLEVGKFPLPENFS